MLAECPGPDSDGALHDLWTLGHTLEGRVISYDKEQVRDWKPSRDRTIT
jgi:hypothetical protein